MLTDVGNFVPKDGEIIIYDSDETYEYPRMKIGDGRTYVYHLPFTNLIAAIKILQPQFV